MCLTWLCLKRHDTKRSAKSEKTSKDAEKYQADAVPPMPMRQNSRGEYVREKPWRSGGVKGIEVLGRASKRSDPGLRDLLDDLLEGGGEGNEWGIAEGRVKRDGSEIGDKDVVRIVE